MRIERRTFNKLALAGAATGLAGAASAQAKPLTIGTQSSTAPPGTVLCVSACACVCKRVLEASVRKRDWTSGCCRPGQSGVAVQYLPW